MFINTQFIMKSAAAVDKIIYVKEVNYLLEADKYIIFNWISNTMIKRWCINWPLQKILLIIMQYEKSTHVPQIFYFLFLKKKKKISLCTNQF